MENFRVIKPSPDVERQISSARARYGSCTLIRWPGFDFRPASETDWQGLVSPDTNAGVLLARDDGQVLERTNGR